jgi:hypothetical protein
VWRCARWDLLKGGWRWIEFLAGEVEEDDRKDREEGKDNDS